MASPKSTAAALAWLSTLAWLLSTVAGATTVDFAILQSGILQPGILQPGLGIVPGCPIFLFTTGVFCPEGFVNPNDECAVAADCGEGELCCSGPSCASAKFCSPPVCSASSCFGISEVAPVVECEDGSVLEAECLPGEDGFCTTIFPECPESCNLTILYDVDASCDFAVQDIVIMIGLILSLPPSPCQIQTADGNGDGALTITDVTLALDCLVNGEGENCALVCP